MLTSGFRCSDRSKTYVQVTVFQCVNNKSSRKNTVDMYLLTRIREKEKGNIAASSDAGSSAKSLNIRNIYTAQDRDF